MRKNITLIIALAIPVIMVLFIIGSVYIPKLFVNPQYSFVYMDTYNDGYYNYNAQITERYTYEVRNGKIVKTIFPPRYDYNNKVIPEYGPMPKLYFYDMTKNSSKEISYEDVQRYNISNESRSPDGYTLERTYDSYGIFEIFGTSRSSGGWYVKKGMGSKKLELGPMNSRSYYSDQVKFLGWVLK